MTGFHARYHDEDLYLPQAVSVVAGLTGDARDGTWFLIRADSHLDAFGHQRQVLEGVPGHSTDGHCICPVEALGGGSWAAALRLAAKAGADVTPLAGPDARVAIAWWIVSCA